MMANDLLNSPYRDATEQHLLHCHLFRRWIKGDYITGRWTGLCEYLAFMEVDIQQPRSFFRHIEWFESLTDRQHINQWYHYRVYPYPTRKCLDTSRQHNGGH